MNKYEWIITILAIGGIGFALATRQYNGVVVGALLLAAVRNGFLREDEE